MDTNAPISQLDPLGMGAYSGDENIFSAYLGPMPTLGRSDPYSKRNTAVWNLPENYKGTNLMLRDTVEDLMFTAHQTYLTTYILPWYATDQLNVQWEQFEANAHLMDITPYQTMSHAVTQKRNIRRAQLVRHGIMAEFELDFMRTAMGRATFLAALNQISRSVQETANAEAIRALAHSYRFQQQFLRDAGIPQDHIYKQYLEQDRERFAIVQKTKNGLEKLDMLINKEMQQYRGEADAFVIPEEIAIFATIARDEKTDYYLAGQQGPDRVNNTPSGRYVGKANTTGSLDRVEPMHMVRNTPVFIVKNLMVENVTEAESQQLSRYRQIGEYVTLIDDCTDYSNYRTDHRSILMYNQEIDDMTKISVEDCLDNCGLFDGDGKLLPAGYDDPSVSKKDLDDDFLTFLSPAGPGGGLTRRRPVQFIFDMAKEYLSAKKIVAAGETLMRRVRKNATKDVIDAVLGRTVGGLQDFTGNETQTVLRTLRTIVGEDSYRPADTLEFFTVAADGVAPVFFRGGSGRNQDGQPGNRPKGTYIASKVDTAFYKLLMSKVPESKRAEVQPILDGPGTALHKGEQVRGKLLEYVGANVHDSKFKDEAPVHKWYEERVNQYRELSATSASEGSGSGGSGRSTGGSSSSIAGYMARGLDLSGTEYEYVYPESADKPRDHLDALLGVHMAECEANAGRSSRSPVDEDGGGMHPIGEGMGLAGIGQFARDTRQERRQDNVGFYRNRLVTLNAHLRALEDTSASPIVKFFARVWLTTRVTRRNMRSLAVNDIVVPMNFLIFRPHMQYRTRAIIKCKQNGGTGLTFIGNSNLMVEAEAGRKMARLHYTTHFRSVIIYPKNVYVQPDVYVQESAGGAGCRFYNVDTYNSMTNENLENSLICVAVPITETIFPSPLDVSGRFVNGITGMAVGSRANYERLHYSSAARYNRLYNFLRSAKNGLDTPNMGPGRNHVNRICYQGHQQQWNATKGEYSKITPSRGHFGKNGSYPGAAPIRCGALEQFEKQNYATRPSF